MKENKIFINVVSIPREILIDIFSLLNPKSLSNLSKTCKFFYEFCKFDFFWLTMCKEFGIDELGNFPNFYTMVSKCSLINLIIIILSTLLNNYLFFF